MSYLLPLGELIAAGSKRSRVQSISESQGKKETRLRAQLGFLLGKMAGSLL